MSDAERVLAAVNAQADRLAPVLRHGIGNKEEVLPLLRAARDALKQAAAQVCAASRPKNRIIAFYTSGGSKIFPTIRAAAENFDCSVGAIALHLNNGKEIKGAYIDRLVE